MRFLTGLAGIFGGIAVAVWILNNAESIGDWLSSLLIGLLGWA